MDFVPLVGGGFFRGVRAGLFDFRDGRTRFLRARHLTWSLAAGSRVIPPSPPLRAGDNVDGALEVWRIAPASEVSRRLEEERAAQESLAQRAAALQEELAPIHKAAKAAEEARARELAALAGAPEPPPKHEPAARGWPLKPGDPGVIRQWLVLAPLPFEGKPDLNVLRQQVPNEARLHPRAGERPMEAPGGLAWTSVRLGEDSYQLDFVELVKGAKPGADTDNQVAYAVAYIGEAMGSNIYY